MPRIKGEKTQYVGVERLAREPLPRARQGDGPADREAPRGRPVEFEGTAKEADRFRAELERALREQPAATAGADDERSLPRRPTVTDFARFWLTGKKLALDPATLRALRRRARPARATPSLRRRDRASSIYCDAVLMADIQAWVNGELAAATADGEQLYARADGPQLVPHRAHDDEGRGRPAAARVTIRLDADLVPRARCRGTRARTAWTAAELQPFLDELRIQAPTLHAITCTHRLDRPPLLPRERAQAGRTSSDLTKTITVRAQKRARPHRARCRRRSARPTSCRSMPELANVLRWHQDELVKDLRGRRTGSARARWTRAGSSPRARGKEGGRPAVHAHPQHRQPAQGDGRRAWPRCRPSGARSTASASRCTGCGARSTTCSCNAGNVDEHYQGRPDRAVARDAGRTTARWTSRRSARRWSR
jgi:hypothetical protein